MYGFQGKNAVGVNEPLRKNRFGKTMPFGFQPNVLGRGLVSPSKNTGLAKLDRHSGFCPGQPLQETVGEMWKHRQMQKVGNLYRL